MAAPVARKLTFRGLVASNPGKWVSGLPSFAVAVVALFCADSLNSAEVERVPLLAQVGKTEVLSIDLYYRSMVERCYRNGEEVDEAAGFLLLLQDAMDREIARAYGLLPTGDEIDALEKHVFDTSKAREILNAIQQGFGEDKAAYRRVFLEPKIIDRKLRTFQFGERSVPKIPYEEWRRERVLEIKVEVFDDTLVERVKEQYPDVWWLKRLVPRHSRASGNPGSE